MNSTLGNLKVKPVLKCCVFVSSAPFTYDKIYIYIPNQGQQQSTWSEMFRLLVKMASSARFINSSWIYSRSKTTLYSSFIKCQLTYTTDHPSQLRVLMKTSYQKGRNISGQGGYLFSVALCKYKQMFLLNFIFGWIWCPSGMIQIPNHLPTLKYQIDHRKMFTYTDHFHFYVWSVIIIRHTHIVVICLKICGATL